MSPKPFSYLPLPLMSFLYNYLRNNSVHSNIISSFRNEQPLEPRFNAAQSSSINASYTIVAQYFHSPPCSTPSLGVCRQNSICTIPLPYQASSTTSRSGSLQSQIRATAQTQNTGSHFLTNPSKGLTTTRKPTAPTSSGNRHFQRMSHPYHKPTPNRPK